LNAGLSYPSIAVAVNVASNAGSLVTNQVAVSGGGAATASTTDPTTVATVTGHPAFFAGEDYLGGGVYYLQFSNGNPFGYYNYEYFPVLYHYDLGFEYVLDAKDGYSGVYLYDFASSHWFYTSPSYPFPYLYDFTLQSILYYYPNPNEPGHYTTNPRYFYDFATGRIISM
jgi:hypothetical protein